MTAFDVYLLFVLLPNLGVGLGAAAFLSLTGFCCSLFIFLCDRSEFRRDCDYGAIKKRKKIVLVFGAVFSITLFMALAIPCKQDVALMYIAPKIINNQDIQNIPGYVLKYIEKEVADE